MKNNSLRRWELALVLSVCVSLCHGLALGGGIAWWGVIFPGLADQSAPARETETAKMEGGEGIRVRFALLDWIDGLWD